MLPGDRADSIACFDNMAFSRGDCWRGCCQLAAESCNFILKSGDFLFLGRNGGIDAGSALTECGKRDKRDEGWSKGKVFHNAAGA